MSEKYTASALNCTLPDTELTAKCREWISKLCASGGKDWRLCVPVDLSNDPDILFSEVVRRFEQLQQENETLKAMHSAELKMRQEAEEAIQAAAMLIRLIVELL